MKRIFIIQNTPLNAPLPLSVYLTGLLKNIKKNKDFEINLIVGKSESITAEIKRLCKKIYEFNASTYSIKDNFNFSFYAKKILKKENKERKIDIVHCFYPNSSLLGAVLFKVFNNYKTKIVYDVRSPWIEMSIERGFINKNVAGLYKFVLYKEEKYLCKFVDSFMIITDGLVCYYRKKIKIKPSQRVYVSPSGVDLKMFKRVKTNIREKYGIKNDEILIGSVGGIAKIRKLEDFLDLFREAVNKNNKLKLMFVGEGDSLSEIKKKVNALNLKKNVIFVGKVPHKEVPKYMSVFDFGLCHLPNIFIYENSVPLKILEYLSCVVPVLASKLKTHEELSKKLKGIFVYHDAKDILRFTKTKTKVEKQNMDEFQWSSIAKVYERMWEKVL